MIYFILSRIYFFFFLKLSIWMDYLNCISSKYVNIIVLLFIRKCCFIQYFILIRPWIRGSQFSLNPGIYLPLRKHRLKRTLLLSGRLFHSLYKKPCQNGRIVFIAREREFTTRELKWKYVFLLPPNPTESQRWYACGVFVPFIDL